MKLFGILIALFCSSLILISASSAEEKVPAFPGAEGFGMYSVGGRGGEIIIVNNLNDEGVGSFRYALEAEGPRVVIFAVSGIINLETPIRIRNPYITIAGQTAPGKGIAIRGNQIHIQTNNVILRFFRIRVGDVNFGPPNHWESVDGIDIGWGDNEDVHDIIIDHCSISWGTDENIGVWGVVRNLTIQNSIISEGFSSGKHIYKRRAMGILVGPLTERISILNNLFIHNDKRNPRMGNGGYGDVRNNIIYNPGYMGMNVWNSQHRQIQYLNIVNNLFIQGPNTNFTKEISLWDPENHPGKIYLANNIGFDGKIDKDNWQMVEDARTPRNPITSKQVDLIKSPVEFPSQVSSTKSFEEMLSNTYYYLGASLPIRDAVDARLIHELRTRTGKIIGSQDEVGGWPVYNSGLKRVNLYGDANHTDPIPEAWRIRYSIWHGEENEDYNENGYTNIEEYLNGTDPGSSLPPSPMDIFHRFVFLEESSGTIELEPNFPNPFSDFTRIRFLIHQEGQVILRISDISGRIVENLVNSYLMPGRYEIIWNPRELSTGVYLGFVNFEGQKETVKIIKIE